MVLESPLQLNRHHFACEFLQERAWIYWCDLRRRVSFEVSKIPRDRVRTCDMVVGPKIYFALSNHLTQIWVHNFLDTSTGIPTPKIKETKI